MHDTHGQNIERMLRTINRRQISAILLRKLCFSCLLASLLLVGLAFTQNAVLSLSVTQTAMLFVGLLIAAPLYALIKERPSTLYTARWVDNQLNSKDLVLSAWQMCQDTLRDNPQTSNIILKQATIALSSSPSHLKVMLMSQSQVIGLVTCLALSMTILINWPHLEDYALLTLSSEQHSSTDRTQLAAIAGTRQRQQQKQLDQLRQLIARNQRLARNGKNTAQADQGRQKDRQQPQVIPMNAAETKQHQLPSNHVSQVYTGQETAVSNENPVNSTIQAQTTRTPDQPTPQSSSRKEIEISPAVSDKMYITNKKGNGDATQSTEMRGSATDESVKTFNIDRSLHSPLINHLVKQYLDKYNEHHNRQPGD